MHGSTTELFLIAMVIIFAIPYLVWRVLRTEYYAPLVVVQIIGALVGGDDLRLGRGDRTRQANASQ